jgi:hypothetical protein
MRPKMENKSKVRVDDSAIKAAVTLAHEHVPGAVLPSSAIELLRTACELARASGSSPSSPSVISNSTCGSPLASPPTSPRPDDEVDAEVVDSSMGMVAPPSRLSVCSRGPAPSRLIVSADSDAHTPHISNSAGHLFRSLKGDDKASCSKRRVVQDTSIAALSQLIATSCVSDTDSESDSDSLDEGMDVASDRVVVVSAVYVRLALQQVAARAPAA